MNSVPSASRVSLVAMRFKIYIISLCFLAGAFIPARAQLLVDTGPGTTQGILLDGGSVQHQWLAGRVTFDQQTRITGVQQWMQLDNAGGKLRIELDQNDGGLPGASLFSTTFDVPPPPSTPPLEWIGTRDVDWHVAPGTYWIAFTPHDDPPFGAGVPVFAPHRLFIYAFNSNIGGDRLPVWHLQAFSESEGLRVFGNEISAVPEPSYYGLIGTMVLSALAAYRRRRAMHH